MGSKDNHKTRTLALAAGVASLFFSATAFAAGTQDRSGKEVVDTVCARCHASGKDGAPRIGDSAAWTQRATKGLDKLTESAIGGVRKMPAHGGQADLSDLEISRAIAYMVSGGHTVDPAKPYASPQHMTGKQLVQERCQECHGTGKNGAPRIGDLAAWKPRLKAGPDALLKSAIRGHNAMPARAGMANLSDADLNAALLYMIGETAAAERQKVNAANGAPSQK